LFKALKCPDAEPGFKIPRLKNCTKTPFSCLKERSRSSSYSKITNGKIAVETSRKSGEFFELLSRRLQNGLPFQLWTQAC
jgi:hypothetical protein